MVSLLQFMQRFWSDRESDVWLDCTVLLQMEDDSHYTLAHYMGRHLAWFGFAQILVQVQLWHYVDVLAPQLSVRVLWILCILCYGFGFIPFYPMSLYHKFSCGPICQWLVLLCIWWCCEQVGIVGCDAEICAHRCTCRICAEADFILWTRKHSTIFQTLKRTKVGLCTLVTFCIKYFQLLLIFCVFSTGTSQHVPHLCRLLQ